MKMLTSIIIIIAIIVIGYFLLRHAPAASAPVDKTDTSMNQDQNTNMDTNTNTSDTASITGLKIEILSPGTGAAAKAGDTLSMNYTGTLTDGTKFDSNVDPKFGHVEPFEFPLGGGMVIQGWDKGLVGMKVGEKRKLTIAPELGYGNRAIGAIPANSTLIFEVELVAIK